MRTAERTPRFTPKIPNNLERSVIINSERMVSRSVRAKRLVHALLHARCIIRMYRSIAKRKWRWKWKTQSIYTNLRFVCISPLFIVFYDIDFIESCKRLRRYRFISPWRMKASLVDDRRGRNKWFRFLIRSTSVSVALTRTRSKEG